MQIFFVDVSKEAFFLMIVNVEQVSFNLGKYVETFLRNNLNQYQYPTQPAIYNTSSVGIIKTGIMGIFTVFMISLFTFSGSLSWNLPMLTKNKCIYDLFPMVLFSQARVITYLGLSFSCAGCVAI